MQGKPTEEEWTIEMRKPGVYSRVFSRRALDKSCYEVLGDQDFDGCIRNDSFVLLHTFPSAKLADGFVKSYEGAEAVENAARLATYEAALRPFARLPIGPEIEDDHDLVIYKNAGRSITVGDILAARKALEDNK